MDTAATRKSIRGMNDPHRGAHIENRDLLPARRSSDEFVSPVGVAREGKPEPTIREIMTTDVRTCRADRSLVCAGTAMHRGDCRFLPVVDDAGRPVAVITDGDICEIGSTDHRPLREILVSEAMSRGVLTCRPEDGVSRVLETMKQHRIRHLPVVDRDGRLAGVVSLTDVILLVEGNGRDDLASLRPAIVDALRAISQKAQGVRTVRVNVFRED